MYETPTLESYDIVQNIGPEGIWRMEFLEENSDLVPGKYPFKLRHPFSSFYLGKTPDGKIKFNEENLKDNGEVEDIIFMFDQKTN